MSAPATASPIPSIRPALWTPAEALTSGAVIRREPAAVDGVRRLPLDKTSPMHGQSKDHKIGKTNPDKRRPSRGNDLPRARPTVKVGYPGKTHALRHV